MITLVKKSLKEIRLLNNLYDLINIREYGIVPLRKRPVLGGGK